MRKKDKKNQELDDTVVNPGDCIGHWLEEDENCKICEIQDSCKDMTKDIEEDNKK